MPRRKESINGIKEKLEYLGLDLDDIPKEFKNYKPLKYFNKTHEDCLSSPYGEYFKTNYLDKELLVYLY